MCALACTLYNIYIPFVKIPPHLNIANSSYLSFSRQLQKRCARFSWKTRKKTSQRIFAIFVSFICVAGSLVSCLFALVKFSLLQIRFFYAILMKIPSNEFERSHFLHFTTIYGAFLHIRKLHRNNQHL